MPHHPSAPLTERQEVFSRHAARGMSGAAAARAAGYAPANAAQQGSLLLQTPHIRARIEALRTEREDRHRAAVAEMSGTLRLLMRRALKAGDHRAAIRCIEVEARLLGLYPDRRHHAPVGPDPLLDGYPAGMSRDRLFDEEEEDPTPTNPEETPAFPMSSSPRSTAPSTTPSLPASPGEDPAPISGRPPRAEAAMAVRAGEDAPLSSTGSRPEMDAGSGPARQGDGAEHPGLIEPADHDEFSPELPDGPEFFDRIEVGVDAVAAIRASQDRIFAAGCPPQATSPAAPSEARSSTPHVRVAYARCHGWDNAWADTPWTPPEWLADVEVRDSRALAR